MKLLAFDTSTERLSIAVQSGLPATVWQHDGPGGAQASLQLIPTIKALMAQAQLSFDQLDAIVFGMGPGSFTGLRTACSVAQGLAFAAGVPVLPVNTLLAVAEGARLHYPNAAALDVTALLDARMDELYRARFAYTDGQWRELQPAGLVKPEHDAQLDSPPQGQRLLAGNVFEAYGSRLLDQHTERVVAWPTAPAMLRLAPSLLQAGFGVPAAQAMPLYVRDKVAQTTEERQALARKP
jgi:tRNA threonylcarbamoyladenosine biosynthesis protein TsaB